MSSSSRQDNSSSSAKSSSSAESSRMQCPDIPAGALAEQSRRLREVVEALCKISLGLLRKRQMLGSVISMQAWLRHSPYAFVPVF